jgi:hypothetical protein
MPSIISCQTQMLSSIIPQTLGFSHSVHRIRTIICARLWLLLGVRQAHNPRLIIIPACCPFSPSLITTRLTIKQMEVGKRSCHHAIRISEIMPYLTRDPLLAKMSFISSVCQESSTTTITH